MALVADYSMQEDGVFMIGATALDNCTRVRVSAELERSVTTRTAFGTIKKIRGTPKVKVTVEASFFDETGIDGALNSYLVGDTTGLDQTLTIRPLGTGAGLKQLILNPSSDDFGMDLLSSTPIDAESSEDLPAVAGTQTWEGWFDEQPAETAQS
jgi:hypothetical protein